MVFINQVRFLNPANLLSHDCKSFIDDIVKNYLPTLIYLVAIQYSDTDPPSIPIPPTITTLSVGYKVISPSFPPSHV